MSTSSGASQSTDIPPISGKPTPTGAPIEVQDAGILESRPDTTLKLMHFVSPTVDSSPHEAVPPSVDGSADDSLLKKQFDKKLRDVMEKARDHAKKIAGERDEFRRQLTERESEILKLKKGMQLSDEPPVDVEKLRSRIRELEQVPTDIQPNPMCVIDSQGAKWALLEESQSGRRSWWRCDPADDSSFAENSTDSPVLSMEVLHRLKLECDKLRKDLELKSGEFSEYKRKANILLSERAAGPSSGAPTEDLSHVKRTMELEDQLDKLNGRISALEKRNGELEKSDSDTKLKLSKSISEYNELRENSKKIISSNDSLSELLHRVQGELDNERKKSLKKSDSSVSVFPSATTTSQTEVEGSRIPPVSSSTQTDEDPQSSVPNLPTSPQKPSPTILATSFDSVAIPLRQQIRALMDDVEYERRQHVLTQNQLQVVKEEFRKLTGECQHSSDLADPVKVEYMRNVGRKFFALAPLGGASEEFESLLPAILPLFQLPPEEIATMLDVRRKKIAASRSKLW